MTTTLRKLAAVASRLVANVASAPVTVTRVALLARLGALAFCAGTAILLTPALFAQEGASPGGPSSEPQPVLDLPVATEALADSPSAKKEIDLFTLLLSGGTFMLPIAALSMLVATFGIERFISLRRSRVLPKGLVRELSDLGSQGGFDPRSAYQLCQKYPSAVSNVIRAMLLKIGRPHAEVELAVKDACSREANRLFANVRWLTFAASCGPLLGLLGTIYGIIIAFHDMTQLEAGVDKGEFLAGGIYIALVTTMSGLTVAIVAATLAHVFEAKIQAAFLEIEELLFHILPQVERYEGRVRFVKSDDDVAAPARHDRTSMPTPPPVESVY